MTENWFLINEFCRLGGNGDFGGMGMLVGVSKISTTVIKCIFPNISAISFFLFGKLNDI